VSSNRREAKECPAVWEARFGEEPCLVCAGIEQEGGCRATYYNHAKWLARPLELPDIRLNNRPPERTPAATSLLDLLRRRFGILGNDEPL
jgi:hypothetical protein